ncbi:MAG: CDGSH iron-sulfur domain-containing protein [Bradymonadales bacterium]|nr:CDGSH iron-sulfur domain-containing protein [Bradymonadales bacterium]
MDEDTSGSSKEKPVVAATSPIALELEAGTYWWCSCGRSQAQPFCDGSHVTTGLTPLEFSLEETRTVYLCRCKQTKTPPFCDGSHNRLT